MVASDFSRGNQFLRSNQFEEAVAAYRSAIAHNPDFYLAHHNLGEALEQLGRWEEAIGAYRRSVELKPEAAWSHLNLSRVLRQVGRVEEAEQVGGRAVAIEPKLADFSRNGYGIKENISTAVNRTEWQGERPLSMNVLLVLYESIESNSSYQAQLYGAQLGKLGVDCVFAVPDGSYELGAGRQAGHPLSRPANVLPFSALLSPHVHFPFADGGCPDVIHAWTPREIVREFVESLLERYPCALVIHLEDNEEYLTEAKVGKPFFELAKLPEGELDSLIPANRYHPVKGRAFLNRAQGLTMIIEGLNIFNNQNVPELVLAPPVDESLFYPRPMNLELRRALGISDDHVVLAYTGNVHSGNLDEVRELYRAVEILNQQGCPTILLRTGLNGNQLGVESWGGVFVKYLGWVEREQVPEILAAADVLVQPGVPGVFNDLRIPSKLPEYFAMGRPVVLPKTNLGLRVKHGQEGYVLECASAEEIATAVQKVTEDSELKINLSNGASEFFLERITNGLIGVKLRYFYRAILRNIGNIEDYKANLSSMFAAPKYGDPVTIVIPNYNKGNLIKKALYSVFNQTYKNLEIIVVDDCSTDNSIDIVKKHSNQDKRLKWVANSVNLGAALTRDRGIKMASSRLISTLDSDDFYSDAQKIEREVRLLIDHAQKGKSIIAFSKMSFYDSDGKKLRDDQRKIVEGDIFKYVFSRSHKYIPHHFLFYKSMYNEVGGLDNSFPIYEDWDLKLRLARKYEFYCTGYEGYAYVNPGTGLSGSNKLIHQKCLDEVFSKNIKLAKDNEYPYIVKQYNLFYKKVFNAAPPIPYKFPQLYLHIGASKTGTSCIQRFSDQNQKLIYNSGVFFLEGVKASSIASTIADNIGFKKHSHFSWLQLIDVDNLIENMTNICKTEQLNTIVVSSEYFWDSFSFFYDDFANSENYRKFMHATKEVFDKFEIKIVLYLRPPHQHFESVIKESIKSVAPFDFNKVYRSFVETYDYVTRLNILEEIFGSENVIVRLYEDEVANDTIADLYSLIGIDGYPDQFKKLKESAKNHSLDSFSLHLINIIRKHLQGSIPLKQLSRIIGSIIKILHEFYDRSNLSEENLQQAIVLNQQKIKDLIERECRGIVLSSVINQIVYDLEKSFKNINLLYKKSFLNSFDKYKFIVDLQNRNGVKKTELDNNFKQLLGKTYNHNHNFCGSQFKKYDPQKPLISIHIPKAAGTSFREVLKNWFSDQLFLHYFKEKTGKMPDRVPFDRPGICIHGHFNADRGLGIIDYYPEADQFVTILRDPFDMAISNYFYWKNRSKKGIMYRDGKQLESPPDIKTYLLSHKSYLLKHIPFDVNLDNFQDVLKNKFIYIGVQEDLQTSIDQLSVILGKQQIGVPYLNKSTNNEKIMSHEIEDIKHQFIKNHPLEYAIYNFALQNYKSIPDQGNTNKNLSQVRIFNARKNQPIVTIITVTLNLIENNRVQFFDEMMNSVISQNVNKNKYEHIVVDGNSQDGTQEIINQYYEKGHISKVVSEPDNGIYDAMNKGIALADGVYILFLNSDDYLTKRSIQEILDVHNSKDPDIIVGQSNIVDLNGNFLSKRIVDIDKIFYGMPVAHQSLVVKTHILREIGYFREDLRISSDLDLVWRLYKNKLEFCVIDVEMSCFRDGGVSMSNISERLKERRLVLKTHYLDDFGFGDHELSIIDNILHNKKVKESELRCFCEKLYDLPNSCLVEEFKRSFTLLLHKKLNHALNARR